MNTEQLKKIIEAALLAAEAPLDLERLAELFDPDDQPRREEIRTVIEILHHECTMRGIELVEVASGFRFQVKQEFSHWVNRLWVERPPRFSRALLEILAIIAYRQPITRGEIEAIRGVSVSTNIMKTLLEREWIRKVGHRDVPGHPSLYGTTRQFLDDHNLKQLSDLPTLAELRDIEQINPDLFEEIKDEAQLTEVAESVN
ncbi:MAG: SMC-Scp complex subunit ScpB [Gammaproteobacteria bacterium]|nr:SMC-Scp complex subunit ScpB [Gammaproteobacteria bacterium]